MPLLLDEHVRDLLALSMTPGLGPIIARRLLGRFGDAEAVLAASARSLKLVDGIGTTKADRFHTAFFSARDSANRELDRITRIGVELITPDMPDYPLLLHPLPDAPLILWAKGDRDHLATMHGVCIVGTRHCTAYGIEQAERFSANLSQAGFTILSGGARGIDSAAHRAAVRLNRPTVAVMGCGLAHTYPPENAQLFDNIVETGGVLLSEHPVDRPPVADQFPARNRLISGMSLGTLVIEAPSGSGALITARIAAEDHNREVMALPGRVDSPASAGANALIRRGEAALVTTAGDVIEHLAAPLHHLETGAQEARLANLSSHLPASLKTARNATAPPVELDPEHAAILTTLRGCELTVDQLVEQTGLDAGALMSHLTMLELRRKITRVGSAYARGPAA